MARKDILKGLLEPMPPTSSEPAVPAPQPVAESLSRQTRGAIGAVSRSIADLRARAVVELDPTLIEAGGLADRIESDEEADEALRLSIEEFGQQVPVLVRPHPETEGKFQIVYGRRRVLAMRDLGQPVKALIRDLDDRELVLAQGQENSARRDLSFIEKVNFARQMEQHGYDRKIICAALTVDKTLLSRMLSVADKVPQEVISLIGAAPSIGRDRWLALAEMIETSETDLEDLSAMIAVTTESQRSDDRFKAAWDYLQRLKARARPPRAEARRLYGADGLPLGQARFDANFVTLKLRLAATGGFEDWLLENFATLYSDWQKTNGS